MSNSQSAKLSLALKQEPDIKEEPVSMGELVGVTASNNNNPDPEQSWVIVIESDNDDDFASFDSYMAKFEAMEAGIEKKEDELKESFQQKGAMYNQRGEYLSKQSEKNRKKSNSQNAKESINAKAQDKGLKLHKCKQCEYATEYAWNLKKHLHTHTGEMPFPCSQCSKRFKQKQNLQAHMETHADDFLFNCSTCFQGFNEKNRKLIHEAKCRILRYECCFCKKSFGPIKSHLIYHMVGHSGEKPFSCQQCSQRFTMRGTLKRHMKTHVDPRSSQCLVRRSEFPQPNQHQSHEQSGNKRKYECKFCKEFIGSRYSELKRHMLEHSNEKPLRCKICEKRFTQKYLLSNHLNSIHGGHKVMAKVSELQHKTTHNGNATETSNTDESTETSAICSPNEDESVSLLTDNEMDSSHALDQSLVSKQTMQKELREIPMTDLAKIFVDCISQKNQQSAQAPAQSTLKFGYIWQYLDNLLHQLTQQDVNELHVRFINQAFEKMQKESGKLAKTFFDYISQNNQQSTQAPAQPILKFGYIWQYLDNHFQQMTQQDVNELNERFVTHAFEKMKEKH